MEIKKVTTSVCVAEIKIKVTTSVCGKKESMKLKEGFIQTQMGDEYVIVATGNAAKDFNGIVRGNETMGFIVEQLEKESTYDSLTKALLDNYQVDEATARADILKIVESLRTAGMLDE
jgi:hypothetical protein